ncbi:MAG: glucose-6-phosphate dehydrogenase [Candidatus Jorgensenbacteria bacterium]|nr:glucose-6-phosphate dehydrogenase [Candidatus Jorgensenbacteria bacterium]
MAKNINPASLGAPTIMVVLGATGDLMAKKIVPALFHLHKEQALPSRFRLVGVSRRNWQDSDFKKHVKSIIGDAIPKAARLARNGFLNLTSYHQLTFSEESNYRVLGKILKQIDDEWGQCSNKLFYLSVPPQFYSVIFNNLHQSGLTKPCGGSGEGWTRVIVEKPFGSDRKSAKALDKQLSKLFKEEQIYRIDHYLAKEMFQNIIAFRFGNNLFEAEWGRKFIQSIHIRLFESKGVEDRGEFYDGVGALRDVGQNHLLEILALLTMKRPESYDAAAIRTARTKLLKTLIAPTIADAATNSFRAQYEGYRTIRGVASDSDTETYFRVRGFLSAPQWKSVPIIMEGGKRLGAPLKEVEIILKHPEPCLCPPGKDHVRNRIIIRTEPNEGITVSFYAKKPGYALELEERSFRFDFRDRESTKSQYTEEYEKLLLDCVSGDQTLFVSSAEIAAMWHFIDPFITAWQQGLAPLHRYKPDSAAIVAMANAANKAVSD